MIVSGKNYILPAFLLLGVLGLASLCGCAKSSYQLNGHIFIATEDAGNYNLGLITITTFRRADIDPLVAARKDLIEKVRRSVNPAIHEAQKRVSDDSSFADRLLGKVKDEQDRGETVTDDLELADSALEQFDIDRDEFKRLTERIYDSESAEPFFAQLPLRGIADAKTDAEGRFNMTLPTTEDAVVVVQASRTVEDTTEHYYWVVPVRQPGNAGSVELMLSNDNLTTSESGSLIHTRDPLD